MLRYSSIKLCVILVVLGLFLLTSCRSQDEKASFCNDELGCVKIGPRDDIHIGVLQALSGAVAPLGQAQLHGLELALDTREGKIQGHRVKLQIEDTGCTAEGGANAALKLIADPQTVAIFGTTCSGAAATASKAMSAAGLTMVSGNNSAPFLTSIAGKAAPDYQPGYFRTAPNEESAGKTAAEYAFSKLGIRKAATLHDNDIYTMGLVESFQKGFSLLGGKIVLDAAINKGDIEMEPVLRAVVNSGAELLFFPLFQPEGNDIVRQARIMEELRETVLMSDGALIQEKFIKDMGSLALGVYFVGPAKKSGAAVDLLAARYLEKYQKPPAVSYYLSGYDAADLLLHAIESAAEKAKDGSLYIGRKELRDTLYSIRDFQGVTDKMHCSEFGDCAVPAFNVLRYDNPDLGLQGLESNVLYSSGHK